MVLKKTLSLHKAGFLLLGIIIVSVLHFILSDLYINSEQNNLNSAKLIRTNTLLLGEVHTLSKKSSNFKKEIFDAAKLYKNNLSILINGGNFSEKDEAFIFTKPSGEILEKLKTIKTSWDEYYYTLNQRLRIKDNETILKNINEKYKTLKLMHEEIEKAYAIEYKDDIFILKFIHYTAILFYITFSLLIYFFVKNKFVKPISTVEDAITNIYVGKPIHKISNFNDDFSNVHSNLNKLYYKTNEISKFVIQLVHDNYDVQFEDYNKDVVLESSLVKLRDKLKENIKLNKIRLEEERIRQWFSEGQAKFNDILRESSSSINKLAEASIKNLVKFFNVAQGGFFIINDETNQPYLNLISAFAYDRIKSINKKIPVGEGLIGMCALEKNTIWLNNVPDDYMDIESGLGEAPPTNILIVPLKTDEKILGVIEIASFYKFTKDEADFMETIAEDIASTLETTKITDRTTVLLEETQKKSTELAYRDSEMSEKVRQLKQTQQELRKSETEIANIISAVNNVLIKIELNTRGKITSANQRLLKALNIVPSEISNRPLSDIVDSKDDKLIDKIVKDVKSDKSITQILTFTLKDKSILKVNTHFSPIKNEKGTIVRILVLAEDISKYQEFEEKNKILSEKTQEQENLLATKNIEIKKTTQDLKKYIKKENLIKAKYDTEKDKKYSMWLNSFK